MKKPPERWLFHSERRPQYPAAKDWNPVSIKDTPLEWWLTPKDPTLCSGCLATGL